MYISSSSLRNISYIIYNLFCKIISNSDNHDWRGETKE
uniref:Uncharacterized protein n=1 Tax=Octopus bimaculoides TaxID=37653 RepID=A0A0L8IAY4_OCTBM